MSVSDEQVLAFVKAEFEEADEARDRIRRRRFGWQVDTQSREFIDTQDFALMTVGNGPILIDRHTGAYWLVSSSPPDIFGDECHLGWSQLSSRALFEQWRREQMGVSNGSIL